MQLFGVQKYMLCFDWRSIFILSLQTQGVVFCQGNVVIYCKQELWRQSQESYYGHIKYTQRDAMH